MYLANVLALELAEERFEALLISFDADCAENAFDVVRGWRGVATEAEKEVCCEMLHFGGCCHMSECSLDRCITRCRGRILLFLVLCGEQENQSV